MPSNHISNKPYHDWLAATYKQRKKMKEKESKQTKYERALERGVSIANDINLHELEIILANWSDRLKVWNESTGDWGAVKYVSINGTELQLDVDFSYLADEVKEETK